LLFQIRHLARLINLRKWNGQSSRGQSGDCEKEHQKLPKLSQGWCQLQRYLCSSQKSKIPQSFHPTHQRKSKVLQLLRIHGYMELKIVSFFNPILSLHFINVIKTKDIISTWRKIRSFAMEKEKGKKFLWKFGRIYDFYFEFIKNRVCSNFFNVGIKRYYYYSKMFVG